MRPTGATAGTWDKYPSAVQTFGTRQSEAIGRYVNRPGCSAVPTGGTKPRCR